VHDNTMRRIQRIGRSADEDDASATILAARIDRIGKLIEGYGAARMAAQTVTRNLEEEIR
jgi:hypothetical protein